MRLRRLGWQGFAAELLLAGAGAAWRHYQARGHRKVPTPESSRNPGLLPQQPRPGLVLVDADALVHAMQAEGLNPAAIANILRAAGLAPDGTNAVRAGRPKALR